MIYEPVGACIDQSDICRIHTSMNRAMHIHQSTGTVLLWCLNQNAKRHKAQCAWFLVTHTHIYVCIYIHIYAILVVQKKSTLSYISYIGRILVYHTIFNLPTTAPHIGIKPLSKSMKIYHHALPTKHTSIKQLSKLTRSNRMAWHWAETLVEIRGTLADIRGTTR